MAWVTAVCKFDHQRRQWREERGAAVIKEFVRAQSDEILREVVSRIKGVSPWAGKLAAKPALRLPGLDITCCDACFETDFLTFSTAKMRATAPRAGGNWAATVDNHWTAGHRPALEGEWRGPTTCDDTQTQ
eukprot:2652714-Pyramimonas_sp.AAC.1